jgi:Carbohydrate family 9 binding domain-like
MHVLVALASLALLGCSVYDDSLVRPSEQVSSRVAWPGVAGSASLRSATDSAARPAADGGMSCAIVPALDYCARLPKLHAAPTIDGTLECGLTLSALPPTGWKDLEASPEKRASYAVAWHRDGLYVYVEVHGAPVAAHAAGEPIFCGDAVEVYVDSDAETDDAGTYDAMGTMQFVVAAPTGAQGPDAWRFSQGESQGAWISKSLAVTSTPDGYSVEAFITAADLGLWQWNPTDRLGFSVAIDVASERTTLPIREGCGSKSGQFFLRLGEARATCPGEPWCDAKAFCSAALLQ